MPGRTQTNDGICPPQAVDLQISPCCHFLHQLAAQPRRMEKVDQPRQKDPPWCTQGMALFARYTRLLQVLPIQQKMTGKKGASLSRRLSGLCSSSSSSSPLSLCCPPSRIASSDIQPPQAAVASFPSPPGRLRLVIRLSPVAVHSAMGPRRGGREERAGTGIRIYSRLRLTAYVCMYCRVVSVQGSRFEEP
ncbi:hypothetical protein LY76DRAFT_292504 [Colletotrichum caudatum]|nr:hypothetical protein LY76DRAFT_292504 [Colletotrichum caudatum]